MRKSRSESLSPFLPMDQQRMIFADHTALTRPYHASQCALPRHPSRFVAVEEAAASRFHGSFAGTL
jgi:hypothetical protein